MLKRMMALVVIAAFMAIAVPAVASAESLWVAKASKVAGNGKSCTQPGYNAIQPAITAAGAGATIHVCTGTYEEQLEIAKPLTITAAGTATVKLPSAPANSTGSCSKALAANAQEVVEACGAGSLKITGLNVEGGWATGTCNNNLYGILASGGTQLSYTNASVLKAGAVPINGCQGGIGIQIGGKTEEASAKLTNITINEYQKNGINAFGPGTKATINGSTVTGAGPTNVIGQNGVEWGYGASVKINKSSLTKNQYEGNVSATGVIAFESGTGSSIKNSDISENDIGVYYEESGTTKLTLTGDKFTSDRYLGLFVLEGEAVVKKSTFNGGEDGIGLYQFSGEANGPKVFASEDTVENMSSYAVIGYSDKAAGDPPGSATITKSKISNNPAGAGVTESVFSENPPSLQIFTTPSDT